MIKSLKELIIDLPIKNILGSTNLFIHKLCFDSRKADINTCFFAVKGTQVNGHKYIKMAIEAGSRVIVCEQLPINIEVNITYILVISTLNAMGIMAANFYDHPSRKLKVVVVTGTNGKTTVVHLLYKMVMHIGHKAGIISTIYNKVVDKIYPASYTTPDVLQLQFLLHLMVKSGCIYCFMEASSHAIIQKRLAGIYFKGAVFTNITHDHLDYHIDFKHYIKAKKKLFDSLSTTSFALMNQEDKNSTIMIQNCKAKKFTFSLRNTADFRAKIITNTLDGLELEINYQLIWFQLIGAFNASNILAAYGVTQLLGLNSQESLIALSTIPPILGRMNKVYNSKLKHVIIDYAHNPDAIQKVIYTLRTFLPYGSKLITVIGCGGNRDQKKRAIIGRISSDNSDIAIFTSDNPRDEDPNKIIHAMQQGVVQKNFSRVLHILDRYMAIKKACCIAQANDIILIAGKGHQYYEEIKGVKHFFCEKKIVQKILCNDTVSIDI